MPLTSNKALHGQPRAMIFRRCLAIYSKSHIFTTWAKITASPHKIAKPDLSQYPAPFSHAVHCQYPPHSMRANHVTRSDTMTSQWQAMTWWHYERHDPRQPIGTASNQTNHQRQRQGTIKLGAAQPRDSKESLSQGTATPCPLSPHSPNWRASKIQILLFIYTNSIFIHYTSVNIMM